MGLAFVNGISTSIIVRNILPERNIFKWLAPIFQRQLLDYPFLHNGSPAPSACDEPVHIQHLVIEFCFYY
jgi:hypothetical protein